MKFTVTFRTDSKIADRQAVSLEGRPIGLKLLTELRLLFKINDIKNTYIVELSDDVSIPVNLDLANKVSHFQNDCNITVYVKPASLNKYCSIQLNDKTGILEWTVDKNAVLNWWAENRYALLI